MGFAGMHRTCRVRFDTFHGPDYARARRTEIQLEVREGTMVISRCKDL